MRRLCALCLVLLAIAVPAAAQQVGFGAPATLRAVQTIAGAGTIAACLGHTIAVTAAGTVTLPSGASPVQRCTIVSMGANVISVDVASASDTIILNGTALTAGNKATSDGTDEATLVCEVAIANTWRCRAVLGVWVDGGA